MPGSGSAWPLIVLAVLLVLVLGISRVPAIARALRNLMPSSRRPPAVFGSSAPESPRVRRNGHSTADVEEATERLPAPELPVTPGRPPYATSMFAAITPKAEKNEAGVDDETVRVRNVAADEPRREG